MANTDLFLVHQSESVGVKNQSGQGTDSSLLYPKANTEFHAPHSEEVIAVDPKDDTMTRDEAKGLLAEAMYPYSRKYAFENPDKIRTGMKDQGKGIEWDNYDLMVPQALLDASDNPEQLLQDIKDSLVEWGTKSNGVYGLHGENPFLIQDLHTDGGTPHFRFSKSRMVFEDANFVPRMINNKAGARNDDHEALKKILAKHGLVMKTEADKKQEMKDQRPTYTETKEGEIRPDKPYSLHGTSVEPDRVALSSHKDYLASKIARLTAEMEEVDQAIVALHQRDEAVAKAEDLESQLHDAQVEYGRLEAEAADLAHQIEAKDTALEAEQDKSNALIEKVGQQEETIDTLTRQNAGITEERDEANEKVASLEDLNEQQAEDLDKLTETKEAHEATIAEQSEAIQNLNNQVEAKTEEIGRVTAEKDSEIKGLESNLATEQEKLLRQEDQNDNLNKQVKSLQSEVEAKTSELESTKGDLSKALDDIKGLTSDLKQMQADIKEERAAMADERRASREELSALRSEIMSLMKQGITAQAEAEFEPVEVGSMGTTAKSSRADLNKFRTADYQTTVRGHYEDQAEISTGKRPNRLIIDLNEGGQIVDKGNEVVISDLDNDQAAKEFAQMAEFKGWKTVKLDGDAEFIKAVQKELDKRNIAIEGQKQQKPEEPGTPSKDS